MKGEEKESGVVVEEEIELALMVKVDEKPIEKEENHVILIAVLVVVGVLVVMGLLFGWRKY